MLAPASLKRLRRPISSTTNFCFNKPLFRSHNSGISNGSLKPRPSSRSFATTSHSYEEFPFPWLFRGGKPRRSHANTNQHSSPAGNTSARRTPWEKSQERARPRLETKTFGPLLADIGRCDPQCAIILDASISMLNSVRAIPLGSPSTHKVLQARKNDTWRRMEDTYLSRANRKRPGSQQQRREFHSSSSRAGWPILLQVAAMLKVLYHPTSLTSHLQ
jgi:hypothetical protein